MTEQLDEKSRDHGALSHGQRIQECFTDGEIEELSTRPSDPLTSAQTDAHGKSKDDRSFQSEFVHRVCSLQR